MYQILKDNNPMATEITKERALERMNLLQLADNTPGVWKVKTPEERNEIIGKWYRDF